MTTDSANFSGIESRATIAFQASMLRERNEALAFINALLLEKGDEVIRARGLHDLLIRRYPNFFTPSLLPL